MSQTPPTSGVSRAILKQLSNPLKLRLVLCAAAIVVWQAAFFGPLSEHVSITTAQIAREHKRSGTARQVERLKKSLAPNRELVGSEEDVNDLMRHVMSHIRSLPLRLVDLKPEKPKDLGPFEAIALHLSLEGGYTDIDEFLGWTEKSKRLLRIDSIRLIPKSREPGRLSVNLSLVALTDKATQPPKAKAEAGKSR